MNTKPSTNGQARKSLAEQLDRLDGMLDGLAEGLNEAVADAVKEAVGVAVQTAVQAVLREVLSRPEVVARLCAAAPAIAPVAPKARLWDYGAGLCRALTVWFVAAKAECGRRIEELCRRAAVVWERTRMLRRFKYHVLAALGVGGVVGVAAYFAAPWLSAAVGGLGGFAVTLALQAWLVVRRMASYARVANA